MTTSTLDLSVGLVNHNGKDAFLECSQRSDATPRPRPSRGIVVDSGSRDENGTSTAKVEPGWDEPSASCWWTT
jgi:hypothetical protein